MATFTDAQQVYDVIGAFLSQLMEDAEVGPKFTAANTIFQIHYTDPDCDMTVDCTTDPPTVTCGQVTDAEISLKMAADDGHKMWLGDLNVALALAKGKVKVTGPASKITKLMPAMRPAFPKYKAFLAETGRSGLGA